MNSPTTLKHTQSVTKNTVFESDCLLYRVTKTYTTPRGSQRIKVEPVGYLFDTNTKTLVLPLDGSDNTKAKLLWYHPTKGFLSIVTKKPFRIEPNFTRALSEVDDSA